MIVLQIDFQLRVVFIIQVMHRGSAALNSMGTMPEGELYTIQARFNNLNRQIIPTAQKQAVPATVDIKPVSFRQRATINYQVRAQ